MKQRLNIIRLWAVLSILHCPWSYIQDFFGVSFRDGRKGYPLGIIIKHVHGGRPDLIPYGSHAVVRQRLNLWLMDFERITTIPMPQVNDAARIWTRHKPRLYKHPSFYGRLRWIDRMGYLVACRYYRWRYL